MGRIASGALMLIGIVCAAACTVSAGAVVVGHDINTPATTVAGSQGVYAAFSAPPNTPTNGTDQFGDEHAEQDADGASDQLRLQGSASGTTLSVAVELTRAAERPPVERIAPRGFGVGAARYPATGFSLCSVRLFRGESPASGDFETSERTMAGAGLDSVAVSSNAGTAGNAAIKPKATTAAGRRYSFYSPTMNLLAETEIKTDTGKPAPLYEYIWFNGHPVAQIDAPSSTHWTFTDHLGTPILQTEAAGNISWRAEHEPFGSVFVLRTLDQHQPLRLPGQEAEQLNLGANGLTERSYNVFRWYRPTWSRYTQTDPLAGSSPMDAFPYARHSPLRYTDRTGLFPGESCAGIRIKRNEINLSGDDKYGHWWIEIGAGESYGWWPGQPVGLKDTLCGVPGALNGGRNFGGTPTQDPHHGDEAEHEFTPVISFGEGCECKACADAPACVRKAANKYSGQWSWPWGQNCHSFQIDLMRSCCLSEPPMQPTQWPLPHWPGIGNPDNH